MRNLLLSTGAIAMLKKVYFVVGFIPLLIISFLTMIGYFFVNFRKVTFLDLVRNEILEIKLVYFLVFKK